MNKNIISNVLWKFGESILAQLVSFVVSVILARLLVPEDYGIVAIVSIFISIATIFLTSGFSAALIQKKDADQTDFSTILFCNLGLSIIIYVIIFSFAPMISKFYENPLLINVLRVLALKLPISAVNSVQTAYVAKKMKFRKFFYSTLIGTIISAVVGIGMAIKGYGVWALVGQTLSNSFVNTLVLFITEDWRPSLQFSVETAKPLVKFGWKVLATDLITETFNQLSSFIIGTKYTSKDLAYYSKGNNIPYIIETNVLSSILNVLFPALSEVGDNYDEIKKIRKRGIALLAFILFPIMFGLIAVADNLTIVLLTDKWAESAIYMRIACFRTIVPVFGATLMQELKAIGRSDLLLKLEFPKKAFFLIITVLAMQRNVFAVASCSAIYYTVGTFLDGYVVSKHIGYNFFEYLFDSIKSLSSAVAMSLVVYFVSYLGINIYLELFIQIVLGIIIYIVLSAVSRNEAYLYIVAIIKKKI